MITQAAVRALSLETVDVEAAVAAALETYDGDRAATILLAAGLRGRRFPRETIRRVIERLDTYEAFLPLIAVTGSLGSRGVRDATSDRGDRRERIEFLVALAESGVIPGPVESSALLGALLLIMEEARQSSAEQLARFDNTDICLRITGLMRIRARGNASPVERSYLALAARILADPVGEAMVNAEPLLVETSAERVPQRILSILRGESLGFLRDSAAPVVASGYTVQRAGEKVGRNDPCPCGSGRKAKKCCGEAGVGARSTARPPSPSSRPPSSGRLAAPTHPGALSSVPLPELARLDPKTLPPDVATALLWIFNGRHLWDLSQRLLDALAAPNRSAAEDAAIARVLGRHPHFGDSPESLLKAAKELASAYRHTAKPAIDLADLRLITAKQALSAGAVEAAHRLARGTTVTDGFLLETEFFRRDAHGVQEEVPLASAEKVARRALSDVDGAGEDDVQGRICDLAFTLLRKSPALGILVARGALDTKYTQYTGALVELVERARARLGLDPHDKALEHLRALTEARDGALLKAATAARDTRVLGELETARRELGAAQAKANGLKAELAKLESAMEAAAGSTASSMPAADPEEARRLRTKVGELKGLIREAQAERQAMRAQLTELQAEVAEGTALADEGDVNDDAGDAVDDSDPGDTPIVPRGLLVPEFVRDAQKDLRDLPSRVSRAALQAIADVGAGEWRHVKQMYSSGEPLFTVRIGIHHRALFRLDEGMLRVLRVVAREELMEVLRRVAY